MSQVFFANLQRLHQSRQAIENGRPRLNAAYRRLIRDADAALREAPLTVIHKETIAPSNDKHDYLSLAPYWWPNPTTPDGLPYIRRDGEVNPERETFPNRAQFIHLMSAAWSLALAFFMTQRADYAAHAASLLRTWFLEPATRMNPHLTYAQIRRGHPGPNPAGIIESRDLSLVVDAVGLLAESPAWTRDDTGRIQDWFAQYLAWLRTSPTGVGEAHARNNHRTWYDQQIASIALFLGKADLAAEMLSDGKDAIATQIADDGSQPEELRRTRSWHYSLFNLEALFRLAALGEHVGEDLWHYEAQEGRGIRKAVDFLIPYARRERPWPYQSIGAWETSSLIDLLVAAAGAYARPQYRDVAIQIDRDLALSSSMNLLFPDSPDL
jgi:hypothetical protein